MPYYISPPPQNPITRFIAGIVAVLAVAGAFMIGMVAFVVVAGIGILAGFAIWLRVAWIKHQLKKKGFSADSFNPGSTHQPGQQAENQQSQDHQGQVIDAEYEVVSEKKDRP